MTLLNFLDFSRISLVYALPFDLCITLAFLFIFYMLNEYKTDYLLTLFKPDLVELMREGLLGDTTMIIDQPPWKVAPGPLLSIFRGQLKTVLSRTAFD